jgi:hypothetical protein
MVDYLTNGLFMVERKGLTKLHMFMDIFSLHFCRLKTLVKTLMLITLIG